MNTLASLYISDASGFFWSLRVYHCMKSRGFSGLRVMSERRRGTIEKSLRMTFVFKLFTGCVNVL